MRRRWPRTHCLSRPRFFWPLRLPPLGKAPGAEADLAIFDRRLALTHTLIWAQDFVIAFVAMVFFARLASRFLKKPFFKFKYRFEFILWRPV